MFKTFSSANFNKCALIHFYQKNCYVPTGYICTQPSSYIDFDKPSFSLNNILHLTSHTPLASCTDWLISSPPHAQTGTTRFTEIFLSRTKTNQLEEPFPVPTYTAKDYFV